MSRDVNSGKEEQWLCRLRRFQASGMSVTRFCRVERVSVPAFYHWRKRLVVSLEKNDSPLFVPVRLTQTAAVEIHLANGARICVPPGHAESLRLAIETAGRLDSGTTAEAEAC